MHEEPEEISCAGSSRLAELQPGEVRVVTAQRRSERSVQKTHSNPVVGARPVKCSWGSCGPWLGLHRPHIRDSSASSLCLTVSRALSCRWRACGPGAEQDTLTTRPAAGSRLDPPL